MPGTNGNRTEGGRHIALVARAGALRKQGHDVDEIERELLSDPARNGLSEREVRTIARSAAKWPRGVRREERPELPPPADSVERWARTRGFSVAAVKALGALAAGWEVEIPMRRATGEICGWRRRRGDNRTFGSDGPKALSSKGGQLGFMATWPLPQDGTVIVVEGEPDACASITAGAVAVVATPSAAPGARVFADLQKILAGRDVVLLPDPGPAGEGWLGQLGRALAAAGCSVRVVPPLPDLDLDKRLARETDRPAALRAMIEAALPLEKVSPPEPTAATETHLDDIENARRFAKDHRGAVAFVPELATWFCFDRSTGLWRQDVEHVAVQGLAKSTARSWWRDVAKNPEDALIRHAKKASNRAAIVSMIELAKSEPGLAIPLAEFDAEPFALAVANGVLDLRTGTLTPHGADRKITKGARVVFDQNAKCPRWERFLCEVFDNDVELVGYVQRLIGYSLSGDVREQIMPIFWGAGCNGKSLLVSIVAELLGDYFTRADANLLLANPRDRRAGEASPEIAALRGARLAVCSETGDGKRLNEALLKELTGGDRLTARPLYGNPITFFPSHKLLLVTNHRPKATEDPALWRRVRLLPFSVSFQGREDRTLEGKLRAELPGILTWAVRGALEWQRRGLDDPQAVRDATATYRKSEDVVALFIGERCELGQWWRVEATRLFRDFELWAEASGERKITQTAFGRRLEDLGHSKEGSRPVYRCGLRLRESDGCDS